MLDEESRVILEVVVVVVAVMILLGLRDALLALMVVLVVLRDNQALVLLRAKVLVWVPAAVVVLNALVEDSIMDVVVNDELAVAFV